MKNEYSVLLENTMDDLLQFLPAIDNDELNKIPFKDSWTEGQVADHILKATEGFPQLFKGKTETTARDPHEHEVQIKNIFLNYDNKMKSPDFILPDDGPFAKDVVMGRIRQTKAGILNAADESDLSKTFTDFSFPGVGHLTGFELLCFAWCHTKRHTQQIKNIHEAIVNK
jgi:hypothetical protein